jgi:hypothetical protein
MQCAENLHNAIMQMKCNVQKWNAMCTIKCTMSK